MLAHDNNQGVDLEALGGKIPRGLKEKPMQVERLGSKNIHP
jgi:hypothetical protein